MWADHQAFCRWSAVCCIYCNGSGNVWNQYDKYIRLLCIRYTGTQLLDQCDGAEWCVCSWNLSIWIPLRNLLYPYGNRDWNVCAAPAFYVVQVLYIHYALLAFLKACCRTSYCAWGAVFVYVLAAFLTGILTRVITVRCLRNLAWYLSCPAFILCMPFKTAEDRSESMQQGKKCCRIKNLEMQKYPLSYGIYCRIWTYADRTFLWYYGSRVVLYRYCRRIPVAYFQKEYFSGFLRLVF